MATLITKDSSGNLKVEIEPNEAQTYLPNEYEPTQTEIETMADDISDLKTAVAAFPVIKTGATSSAVTVAAGSYEAISFDFDYTFKSAPEVFLQLDTTGDNGKRGALCACLASRSKTGFTARVYNNSDVSIGLHLHYLAILV